MKDYKYDFTVDLVDKLTSSINNNYGDENIDYSRFTIQEAEKGKKYLNKELLFKYTPLIFKKALFKGYLNQSAYGKYLQGLNWIYNQLADDYSRKILNEIIAYSILGFKYVMLSLNTPSYWKSLKTLEEKADKSVASQSNFNNQTFSIYNLDFLNIDIKLYCSPLTILVDFINEQYAYKKGKKVIRVESDDVVIDGGACWGDTALYFANLAGVGGKVYSFEFIESNINFFNKNLSLNPQLKERIEIVKHPLWNEKGVKMKFRDNGPGSRIFLSDETKNSLIVETQTVDDLVRERNIQKVDFIKLDIEGSELKALEGAKETIKKFRPKLAVAVYHSIEDLYEIPKFIDSLGLGYKFYMDHFTIHWEETILFATTEN